MEGLNPSAAAATHRQSGGGAPAAPGASRRADGVQQWPLEPLRAGRVVLRSPNPHHQAFLERVFRNPRFMRHYHRFQDGSPAAVQRFIATAQQSPLLTRRIDWVVQDAGGPCIGVAGLVDIDWPNARAELLIGFPTAQTAIAPAQASVAALCFAFERLGLAKLVAQVYADNPSALAYALHFGFAQEGVLRHHIATREGRLDVIVNGLLRESYRDNELVQRLRRRWIDWT